MFGETGINRNTWRLIAAVSLIVFAVFFLGGVGVVVWQKRQDNKIRDAQVRACKRLGNPRAQQITKNGQVLKAFLNIARDTRLASARENDGEQRAIDLRAAERYHDLTRELAPAPLADCEQVYPKP